ncbi:hypothetical protein RB195_013892 [Necator americanus]|uniref:Uncharacterized protein n=1 Tax=Necator americanus TaxID=51031 RepID=A0ABR1DYU2_NECAM
MQDEHYHFQTKRLRTDSTCLGDTPSISHLFESTLTTEAANNKETINCLIGTLQRLRHHWSERRQQPATSTTDWAGTPSGPSSAGESTSQAESPPPKTSPGRDHTVEDSAIFDAVKEDLEINTCSLATGLGCRQSTVAFPAKKIFAKFEEAERVVNDFFDSQSPQFWEKWIADLPIMWDTVVINNATTAHCCTSTSLARENANQLVATSAANISNPHSMESRDIQAWDSTSLQGFTFNQQVQQRQMQQPFTFSQICYDPNKTNLLNARTRVLNHAPDYSSSTSKNLTSQLITTGADSCYHGLKLDEIMGKTKSTHGNQTDSSLVANYLTMFNSQPQCAGVPVTSAVNGVPSSQMLAVRPLPRQRKIFFNYMGILCSQKKMNVSDCRKIFVSIQKQPHLHGSTSTMWFSKVQLLNNQHLEPVYEEDAKEQDTVIVDCSDRECNEWSIYSVPLPTQLHVRCHCFQNKP